MVLKVEIYGFMMRIFAPNRKNRSCQEMGGQYLRWCSMGTSARLVQGLRLKAQGIGLKVLGNCGE